MTTTATDVAAIPPPAHDEAMAFAAVEADRLLALVDRLGPDDWDRPTDCTGWDVKALLSHVLGTMQGWASIRAFVRIYRSSTRAAQASGRPMVDEMTARQVADHAALAPDEIARRLHELAPRQVRARRRMPSLVRRIRIDPGSGYPKWSLGYLNGVIQNRDFWMHRVDLARATSNELVLTADHDGRLVAGVVAEWAGAHGAPFELELDGPAGGRFARAGGGHGEAGGGGRDTPAELRLDAVEFCRTLSGRASGTGLLTQEVPF
jgi:uncharacterized protein (TIGR03083 family)